MKHSGVFAFSAMLLAGCVSFGQPAREVGNTTPNGESYSPEIIAFSKTRVEPILYIIFSSCAYRVGHAHWPKFLNHPGKNSILAEFNATTDQQGNYHADFRLKSQNKPWSLRLSYVPGMNTCDYSLAYNNNPEMDKKMERFLGKPGPFTGSLEITDSRMWESTPTAEFETFARQLSAAIYPLFKFSETSKSPEVLEKKNNLLPDLVEILFKVGICVVFDIPPHNCR